MAESSWPTAAGGHSITDQQWEMMTAGFAGDGIIGAPTDPAVVYADSTGMQVKVRANKLGLVSGHGWFSGSTEFTRTIAANASGSTRIDLVILRFTRSTQDVTCVVKQGTAGAGAPALTQDPKTSGTGVYEVAIAQVTVASGASTISAANVVAVARFLSASIVAARAKMYSLVPPASAANTWTNTAAPTADLVNSTGMFPVAGARLTLDKQSPDTALDIDMQMSGYTNGQGRIVAGVRVMASGYTSSNHIVAAHYFNLPMSVGSGGANQWHTTDQGDARHWHNIRNDASGYHNHNTSIPAIHMSWGGRLHIAGLAALSYTVQPWFYVASGINYQMDSNDVLSFRLAEV